MNRFLFPALLLAATLASGPASTESLVIDLDKPGALQFVQQERPADYERVVGILHDAETLPQSQVAGWVRTRYHAEDVRMGLMLLVSYPPKRRLAFALGEASYTATVTVSPLALPSAQ